MQFAERRFAGHAAAGQHADAAQATAGFVDVQLHAAFMALGDCDHADALLAGALQAVEEGRVVAGAGAAAEAFQDQALDAAVDQRVQLRCADAGEQWQHGNVGERLRLTIIQCFRQRADGLTAAGAVQCGKRVTAEAADFRAAGRLHQLAVEVQVHPRRQAFAQCLQGAVDVFPGIAVGYASGQHGAGEYHRGIKPQQLKAHGCCAVGQGVGAMEDQHGIAALGLNGVNHRLAQTLPVGRRHVGAVDQGRHLAELPLGHHQVRLAGQLVGHARLETGGGRQAVFAGLHADGAAGVEHHHVLGRSGGFAIHGSLPVLTADD